MLDLGSGGGIDVLLSAKRVGPTGRAFGLDMTDEMLALAQRNAAEAGATNVEFLKGHIEAIPLPADSIDVVISNCVVNLAADKPAVFSEIARVLRPGGRIGITDIVADDSLHAEERAERGSYVGCIAGALSFTEFETGLRHAGLTDVSAHHDPPGRPRGCTVSSPGRPSRWTGQRRPTPVRPRTSCPWPPPAAAAARAAAAESAEGGRLEHEDMQPVADAIARRPEGVEPLAGHSLRCRGILDAPMRDVARRRGAPGSSAGPRRRR